MNVTQSIETVVQSSLHARKFSPTHCDVRCAINDLTRDNPRIVKYGYDQDRAFRVVRNKIGRHLTGE